MKKLLLILSLALVGCSFPLRVSLESQTPSPSAPTPTLIPTPFTAYPPGTEKNPLILALAPSVHAGDDVLAAGQVIAAFIEAHSGYKVVTVVPASETELVDAIAKSNAQIASLTPFGYLYTRQDHLVTALLGSVRDGKTFYGAQFIVNREGNFQSYFDPLTNENRGDAAEALKQFAHKKPCWSDKNSPSAYVVPLGLLNQAHVETSAGAFLEGQPSVVRAVYAKSICDFGATYIDARNSATLESDYPDVMDKVNVIWRVPAVIPYENISVASALPADMRRVIQRAFIDLMLTDEGKSAVQTAYGIDALQPVDDSMYDPFEKYVNASGLDLIDLLQ